MGVTRFKSQLKCTNTTGKMTELRIPWQNFLNDFSTAAGTTQAACFGTGAARPAVDEANSSGLSGIAFASSDELDFFFVLPDDFDATAASYLDTYTSVVASGTLGDTYKYVLTYNAVTPVASGTAAGDQLGDATTTSGVTNMSNRTLHTSQTEGNLLVDSFTIAADTLTEGDAVHGQLTGYLSGSEGEIFLAEVVFRYARKYV